MMTTITSVSEKDIAKILDDPLHNPKITMGGQVITTGEGRIIATVVISCNEEPYILGIGTATKCPKDPNAGKDLTIKLAFYRALQQYSINMQTIVKRKIEEYIKVFEFYGLHPPNDC